METMIRDVNDRLDAFFRARNGLELMDRFKEAMENKMRFREPRDQAPKTDLDRLENPADFGTACLNMYLLAEGWPLESRPAIEITGGTLVFRLGVPEFAPSSRVEPSLPAYHWEILVNFAGYHVNLLHILCAVAKKWLPTVNHVCLVVWCGCSFCPTKGADKSNAYHLLGKAIAAVADHRWNDIKKKKFLSFDRRSRGVLYDHRRGAWEPTWRRIYGRRTTKPIRRCVACGKAGTKLRNCVSCSRVGLKIPFCDVECQRRCWKRHKAFCQEINKDMAECERWVMEGTMASPWRPHHEFVNPDCSYNIRTSFHDEVVAGTSEWRLMTDNVLARWERRTLAFTADFFRLHFQEGWLEKDEDDDDDDDDDFSAPTSFPSSSSSPPGDDHPVVVLIGPPRPKMRTVWQVPRHYKLLDFMASMDILGRAVERMGLGQTADLSQDDFHIPPDVLALARNDVLCSEDSKYLSPGVEGMLNLVRADPRWQNRLRRDPSPRT